MNSTIANEIKQPPAHASLVMKILNIFISPGEVFAEVVAAPPRIATWLVPALLVCSMAMALVQPTAMKQQPAVPLAHWRAIVLLDVCLGVFVGTVWSAFMIWLIGRMCLKARFSFMKAVEITALSGTILILSAIITCLLVTISGNLATRPSLSLLMSSSSSHPTLFAILDAINVFHLWITGVLAVGLSKLSGVSFKECAFWVFGYWVLSRIAIILLA